MQQYQVIMPIGHSGQKIDAGSIVNDTDLYGVKAKSKLDIEHLLAKRRVVAVSSAQAPSAPSVVLPPNKTNAAVEAGRKL
jgi:hypothetical protein